MAKPMICTVALAALASTNPCMAQTATNSGDTTSARSQGKAPSTDDIIVTAQKRSQRLIDTPVPVAVISATNLVASQQTRLADYFNQVPGLSYNNLNRGESLLAIRGVTTGGAENPTVGTVIDDIPFGATTGSGFGFAIPEIDPSSLASVEVLRGPQGTLYGASSMGGLIKFTTLDPATDGVSGRFQAGIKTISHAGDVGYNVSGAINLPASDTFAIRASAYEHTDPGYIDNPVKGVRDINTQVGRGGRISALWRPSSDFSLKLGALYQRDKRDANSLSEDKPGLGELEQDQMLGTGYFRTSTQAYSAVAKANVGQLRLTSLSGYSVYNIADSVDLPGRAFLSQFVYGVGGAALTEKVRTKKFSQELRLEVPLGKSFEWLIGGFYTNEDSSFAQNVTANDADSGAFVGYLLQSSYPFVYREYAAFTNLTAHFTDKFDVEFGARQSWNKQKFSQTTGGPLAGGTAVLPESTNKDSSFTYLVTPSFKLAPDMLLYARFASGYRPGGPNFTVSGVFAPPVQPDKTNTYEAGTKGRLLDGVFEYDVSIYHIDWKDIQIITFDGTNSIATNGGSAKSEGAELTVSLHPAAGTTLSGWATYNVAELKTAFPADSIVVGAKGERLPYSSRFSGNLSIDQRFDLTADWSGSVGATLIYVGDRFGTFNDTAIRQKYPSYVQLNLRAGLTYGDWALDAFATNVTDRRGLQSGGIGTVDPVGFQFIQPRTIGLNVSRKF